MRDIKNEYDAAASRYATVDELPIRGYAEVPTFLGVLGDVTGAEVLDLACGAGFLTRIIASRGAERVVGVDASAPMIELARAASVEGPAIEYHVHDVATMPPLGEFDVVTAEFLLNYASSPAELGLMCERVFAGVRPGGRFVGSVPDSRYDIRRRHDTRYGVTYEWRPDMADGDRFAFRFHHSEPPLTLECYYWRLDVYEQALVAAGFRDVEFHPWMPSAEGIDALGHDFWAPWIANPMITVVSAVKPAAADAA